MAGLWSRSILSRGAELIELRRTATGRHDAERLHMVCYPIDQRFVGLAQTIRQGHTRVNEHCGRG